MSGTPPVSVRKPRIEKNHARGRLWAFLVLAVLLLAAALFARHLCPYDPNAQIFDTLAPPSAEHLCGTDRYGRDLFSRILMGLQTSVLSTLALVAMIAVAGSAVGVLCGYWGGAVDAVMMRVSDVCLAFPGLVFAMAIAGVMGASIRNAVIAVSLVSWTKYARLARSLVLKIRNRDFVAAAVVTGSRTPYMLLRYMLPNVLPTLIITAATDIGGLMLELASLSFLGFGAKAPAAEWGLMLNEGRTYMESAPWLMVFPGLAIFITVVIFNMLGDSLRDILDPKNEEGGA